MTLSDDQPAALDLPDPVDLLAQLEAEAAALMAGLDNLPDLAAQLEAEAAGRSL